jgi:hypothetical protein
MKMAIFPKAICMFKISMTFMTEIEKSTLSSFGSSIDSK